MGEFDREWSWRNPPAGGLDRLRAALDAQTADNEPSPAFALAPLLSFVLTLVMATMLFGYPGDARLAVSESHLRALTRPEGVDKARPADNLHLVSETGEGVRLYLVVMREGPPAAEAP